MLPGFALLIQVTHTRVRGEKTLRSVLVRQVTLHCNGASTAVSTARPTDKRLFTLSLRKRGRLARRLQNNGHSIAGQEDFIGVDTIESFARLAGARSLLASFKIGRGGGWNRARQRLARGTSYRARHACVLVHREWRPNPGTTKRYRDRLRALIVALWIALLLSIVGYAAVAGEAGMAQLDDLGFVARDESK